MFIRRADLRSTDDSASCQLRYALCGILATACMRLSRCRLTQLALTMPTTSSSRIGLHAYNSVHCRGLHRTWAYSARFGGTRNLNLDASNGSVGER